MVDPNVDRAPRPAAASAPAAQPRRPFATRWLPPERLVIPAIDLDARVVPIGTQIDANGMLVWETAAFAVGHHAGSANPGELGKVVLSGHLTSVRKGSVFRRLPEVKLADGVYSHRLIVRAEAV